MNMVSVSSDSFSNLYEQLSKEEVFFEYLNFVRTFPDLLDGERENILETVKSELGIDNILCEIKVCNFERKQSKANWTTFDGSSISKTRLQFENFVPSCKNLPFV